VAKGRPRNARRDELDGAKKAPAQPHLPQVAGALAESEPPEEMDPAAKDVWRLAIADMARSKVLVPSDLASLKVWCEAFADHEDASRIIRETGRLVKGAHGPMPNPMLRVKKEAAATMRQYSDVLGLNPLARIRGNLMAISAQSQALDVRERIIAVLTEREKA
jgi:P27 family predicted phage terminase small subunit